MATLQSYKKYKSVDLNFAKQIPIDWTLKRGKFFFKEISERSKKGEEQLLSVSEHKGIVPRDSINVTMFQALSYEGYKLCNKGDIVINSLWAWHRGLGVSEHHGIVSTAYGVYRPLRPEQWNHRYLNYLIRDKTYVGECLIRSKGIWESRYLLSGRNFLDIPILQPPLEVQNGIVVYLDKKNSEIDKFIRNKERLVELLEEEKQSEIDKAISLGINNDKLIFGRKEIPNYPSHWQLKRTKHLFSILNGYAFSTDLFISEGVQVLKISSLYQNELSLDRQPTYVDRKYLKKLKQFVVTEGNILISLTGTLGKKDYGYAIQLKTDELYLLNQRVAKLIPKSIIDGNYALYLLRSDVFLNQLYMCPSGTKQANLCNDDILSIHIAIPGKFEQIEIANYLNASLAKFDIAISKAQKEISSIKEYREALITDLVTGKRSLNCDLE
jgi:type I restriction enzyme S subunit